VVGALHRTAHLINGGSSKCTVYEVPLNPQQHSNAVLSQQADDCVLYMQSRSAAGSSQQQQQHASAGGSAVPLQCDLPVPPAATQAPQRAPLWSSPVLSSPVCACYVVWNSLSGAGGRCADAVGPTSIHVRSSKHKAPGTAARPTVQYRR